MNTAQKATAIEKKVRELLPELMDKERRMRQIPNILDDRIYPHAPLVEVTPLHILRALGNDYFVSGGGVIVYNKTDEIICTIGYDQPWQTQEDVVEAIYKLFFN